MFRPLFALALFTGGLALGQNAPLPPPLPANAALGPGAPTRLQFPNTDVKEVLGFYERLTKKRLIIDNQIQGTVHIVVAGEVPTEEAARIIEINLLLNGFTLIPDESGNFIKVTKNPRAAAIPIVSDAALLPEGEQVVTYLAKVKFADPTEIQQVLTGYIAAAPGQYTNITALPKSQALLITENTATIRGLLRVLEVIDRPPAEVESVFIALERADAADIIEKLKSIFEKKDANSTTTTRTTTRQPAPAAPGTPPVPGAITAETTSSGTLELRAGALAEGSIIVGEIKLTADVRTNRIHVVTRKENLKFITGLIREFDAAVKFGEPVSYPLKWVPVGEVINVVVKAISEPGMKIEESSGPGRVAASSGNSGASGNLGSFSSGNTGGGGSNGSGTSDFNVSEGLSTEAVDTTPEARVVGTTKLIADKNANALIVIGGEDVKEKVLRLLHHLDQRIPQVMFHTVIGELNVSDREQFGVDYIIRNSGLGILPVALNGGGTTTTPGTNDGTGTGAATGGTGNAGTNTGTTTTGDNINTTSSTNGRQASDLVDLSRGSPALNFNNLLNQSAIRGIAAAGSGGLTAYAAAGNSLTAVVTALENTNKFRVVSRPSIFAKNNKKALIASGQEIAVPTSIQSSLTGANNVNNNNGIVTNSSVQFKRVALQLEVVPLINSDREVSVELLQKIDEVSGSTRIDNNDIPNIATRFLKTNVSVPNGVTLALGGLIKQSQNRARTGIPILSNIPVLGYLFSTTTKEKVRTELIILMRPIVSWTPPESVQIRERAQEFLNTDPDLEASLFPGGSRHVAPPELPPNTPIPLKKSVPPKAAARKSTPAPRR